MTEAAISFLDGPAGRLALRRRGAGGKGTPILFVHGATLASELYDIPGSSWMQAAAAAGRPAFGIDLRGYGRSEKPASFNAPEDAPPYARAVDVLADIDQAVEEIRAETGAPSIDLVGGSWGSITSALYASGPGREKLRRLVLFAPIFAERNPGWLALTGEPDDLTRPNPRLGACRNVTEAELRARWDAEIPVPDKSAWRPEPVFRALVAAALAADSAAHERTPSAFRAPNGCLLDLHRVFSGEAVYDPAALLLPVLLIRGDADPTSTHADASRLFARLGAAMRQYVVIGGASHFAIAERAAPQVFAATEAFLAQPDP